ncbi:hypothetical protein BOX15_Mlig026158g1 [Macrostomum lignano]|uniref:Transcription and mRNA export factor ENY2 n=1 Tax=Macrostomum lignano TaxID=282301 RepID=A0A267DQL5_9PLAT|nr:hypothetical protein BOX15_Mlig026158g1 [Macrostomum lignano]
MSSSDRNIDRKCDEVRSKIEAKLQASGEQDRIRRHIRAALNSSGWMEEVKSQCRDLIRAKGVEYCTVEEIVEAVLPQARERVPKELKQEVLDLLWKFVDTHDIGLGDDC